MKVAIIFIFICIATVRNTPVITNGNVTAHSIINHSDETDSIRKLTDKSIVPVNSLDKIKAVDAPNSKPIAKVLNVSMKLKLAIRGTQFSEFMKNTFCGRGSFRGKIEHCESVTSYAFHGDHCSTGYDRADNGSCVSIEE